MRAGHLNYAWKKVIRDRLWTNQGRRCFYCTSFLRRCEATLDHKIPKKKNGRDEISNFVAACDRCNRTKGSMPKSRFKKIITDRSPQGFHVRLIRAVLGINKQADRACRRIEAMVR